MCIHVYTDVHMIVHVITYACRLLTARAVLWISVVIDLAKCQATSAELVAATKLDTRANTAVDDRLRLLNYGCFVATALSH